MGMFDKETQLKNAEFATGDFDLYSGKYIGQVSSAEYGPNAKATVVAGPDKDTFVVYGVMAEQIGRMQDGDLPARVAIGQDGRANIFVKASS